MFEQHARIVDLLQSGFEQRSILIVGDLMLDRYLWGQVSRISPEAPVPVVHVVRETECGGGAANVAGNLASLGVRPLLAGFVGDDPAGLQLTGLLNGLGVDTTLVMALPNWPTITKTRIFGGPQHQLARLDYEQPLPTDIEAMQQLLQQACRLIDDAHTAPAAIILSDYAKGVLTEPLCQGIINVARQHRVPVLIDPKGNQYQKYRGATVLSPNRSELAAALTCSINTPLETLLQQSTVLRQQLAVDFLAVTLSEQGIALVEEDGRVRRIPALAREVFDVSGAGDTVIATLAAGFASGLSRMDAIHLANLAASVVVAKVGTTPIERTELLGAISCEAAMDQSGKICSVEVARQRVAAWRSKGERVVFTNGCFDLLHAGHVSYLEQARRRGHHLVIGLNTDRSVQQLKGPNRPIIHEQDRARILAALAAVDLVVLFDEDTPLTLIRAIRPDVLAKGADYQLDQVVGATDVTSWGGEVALITLVEGQSTSRIVADIRSLD
ncbi:MAG: D-glycero-beta-D-manno-heptose-7-phosphate kinase [Magnetococcales bacterium]|nr:D-glycero-beta-D-manno-heptose-7-phosphate kinase [Magnetococcales bacterium]